MVKILNGKILNGNLRGSITIGVIEIYMAFKVTIYFVWARIRFQSHNILKEKRLKPKQINLIYCWL